MHLDSVIKPDTLSVAVPDAVTGVPKWMTMHSSHVSFKTIVRALKRKEFAKVPRLFDKAQLIADKSQGAVTVKKEGIYYKGTLINNSLTSRILQMIKEGKPVSNMLKFMDRLYANPQQFAIDELFDWLNGSKLPITDDGRFTAYKVVKADYKDIYTGTIDNSPGQMVFMLRTDVCTDRHNTCAAGLHFCSSTYVPSYGVTSSNDYRVIQLAIDPADVVSIPTDYNFTKGRTWQYEVIKEVPRDQVFRLVDQGIDIDDYQTAVYSIAKDRKKLIADILALATIKSMLRKQKKVKRVKRGRKTKTQVFAVSERSIRKMTYGRLVNLYKQFAPPEVPTITSGEFYDQKAQYNRLRAIRASYGFSRGQIAETMGKPYSTVFGYEIAKSVAQTTIDSYLDAVIKLSKLGKTSQTGISFPVPTQQKSKAAAAGSEFLLDNYQGSDESADEFEVDEFGYEDIPF